VGVEGKARVGRDRPKKKIFKRKRGYIEVGMKFDALTGREGLPVFLF